MHTGRITKTPSGWVFHRSEDILDLALFKTRAEAVEARKCKIEVLEGRREAIESELAALKAAIDVETEPGKPWVTFIDGREYPIMHDAARPYVVAEMHKRGASFEIKRVISRHTSSTAAARKAKAVEREGAA